MSHKATVSRLAVVLAVFAAGLFVAGCGEEGGKGAAAAGRPKIALIMKSLANPFFKTMEDGARADQKQHAAEYDLVAQGIKDERDVAKQVDLAQQMIAQGVQALVIAPADSKALIPVCKQAMDKGIVVVNIDNKLDADTLAEKNLKVPFVGPDNRKGAKAVGDYLAKALQKGDEVAIIEGAPNAFNATQRKLGFEDAMNAAGMKVVASQTGQWETGEANKVVSGILLAQPNLKAILCANDDMALGALAALRAANKVGQIKVVGFDNIAGVQEALKKGDVLATADQHADQIAVAGIKYALEILKTKSAPADKETVVDLVTKENVK